jgi:hypothetical protein
LDDNVEYNSTYEIEKSAGLVKRRWTLIFIKFILFNKWNNNSNIIKWLNLWWNYNLL